MLKVNPQGFLYRSIALLAGLSLVTIGAVPMQRHGDMLYIAVLTGTLIPGMVAAQTSGPDAHAPKATPSPSAGAAITKFYIAQAAAGSGYETGPLHIVYSDGTDIIEELPPLNTSTGQETIFNQVGFSGVQLADDQQTLGWTVQTENCCTSYSIPLTLVVFRSGRVLHSVSTGQMLWQWTFADGGKQAATVWGPTHGSGVGDYRLYDVATGKLVAEVWGDAETQSLKPDAPDWASRLEQKLNGQDK